MNRKQVRALEAGDCVKAMLQAPLARGATTGVIEMKGAEHHCIRWLASDARDIVDLRSPLWERIETL